ncbi:hypothetical protein K9K85_02315 [Patescibacteria group bacterium]|nr:hypothetical protein [Patescibacteria group bacterium]
MKERTLRDLAKSPKIGDFLAREKEIKSWPDCWFDPNDQSKMKIFTKKVETDLPAFVQKIKEKGSLSLDDIRTNRGEVQEEIREVTQDLTLLKKYVGMSYFFLKNKIPFPTMLHKDKKESGLVFSFSLEGQFYNWDEEIALLHPFILSTWKGPIDWPWAAKCRWLQGVGDWLLIIDRYLEKEKQGNSFKKKLLSLLGVDQKVREIMDRAKMNLAELKAVLGINDFFKNASLIERIWASVSGSDSSKVSFNDKALCVIKYYGGASDERGWDVRVDRSTLHLFYNLRGCQ